jgi:hypothetical protein
MKYIEYIYEWKIILRISIIYEMKYCFPLKTYASHCVSVHQKLKLQIIVEKHKKTILWRYIVIITSIPRLFLAKIIYENLIIIDLAQENAKNILQ